MKNKRFRSFSTAIIAIIALIGLMMAACDNSPGGGNEPPPERAFSVSGEFDIPGGNTAQFSLTSEGDSVAAAFRASRSSVTETDFSIIGVLDDGDITFRLRGTYDPNRGTWQASARSTNIVFTLGGIVDSNNASLGSTATIAVNTGTALDPVWATHIIVIDESAAVTVSPDGFGSAQEGEEGIPAFARGWWQMNDKDGDYSFDAAILVSPWRMSATVTTTTPYGSFTEEETLTVVEIENKGSGVYRIFYTFIDFPMTNENFAKAFSSCIGSNIPALPPNLYELLTGREGTTAEWNAFNAFNGKWVYYDEEYNFISFGSNIFSDDINKFFGLNYWFIWAPQNGIDAVTRFSAIEVKFPNTTSPSYFDLISLVVPGVEYEWDYTYDWSSLAALKAAPLVYAHEWERPDFGWTDGPSLLQPDLTNLPAHLIVPGWNAADYEAFFGSDPSASPPEFPSNWTMDQINNWMEAFFEYVFSNMGGGNGDFEPTKGPEAWSRLHRL
jgi:hypothetical protein